MAVPGMEIPLENSLYPQTLVKILTKIWFKDFIPFFLDFLKTYFCLFCSGFCWGFFWGVFFWFFLCFGWVLFFFFPHRSQCSRPGRKLKSGSSKEPLPRQREISGYWRLRAGTGSSHQEFHHSCLLIIHYIIFILYSVITSNIIFILSSVVILNIWDLYKILKCTELGINNIATNKI